MARLRITFDPSKHPRGKGGKFSRSGRAAKKDAKRTAKRARRIVTRDRDYYDLQTTQNQFSAREARDYVNASYRDIRGVPIGRNKFGIETVKVGGSGAKARRVA